MGSIRIDKSGKQHHWTDKWHDWKPDNPLPRKRNGVKSSVGQKQLFEDVPVDPGKKMKK